MKKSISVSAAAMNLFAFLYLQKSPLEMGCLAPCEL